MLLARCVFQLASFTHVQTTEPSRVLCQINSANELILTELILENTLATFAPEEIVALLSCFVFQEKQEGDPVIPEQLVKGKEIILDIAEKLGRVQDRHKVPHDDYATTLKFGLVEAVYEWAKGMVSPALLDLLTHSALTPHLSLNLAAFRADHRTYRCRRGHHRSSHHPS